MGRQVTRPSEPWEFSDGAVYLVRELCVVDSERGVQLFEEMADIARLTQFVQADSLRETIWKQVNYIRTINPCNQLAVLTMSSRYQTLT